MTELKNSQNSTDAKAGANGVAPEERAWVAQVFSAKVFNLAVAIAALLIMLLPVGMAAVWLGMIRGESPCILCGNERFGMVLVAALAMFILRYGPHRKYYFMLLMVSFFYLYATFRHWGNFSQNDYSQGLAESVLGVHTFTWGIVVYWIVVAFAGIGLLWLGRDAKLRDDFGQRTLAPRPLNKFTKVTGIIVVIVTLLNSVQFFVIDGPPPFAGTGCGGGRCPQRFSFDVTKTAPNWSLELWHRLKVPIWNGYSPDMVHLPGDPMPNGLVIGTTQGAPVAPSGKLEVVSETPLGFDAIGDLHEGRAGGIAYDPSSKLFGIVSTGGGLYYVKDDFKTVVSSAIMDRVNGWDITHTGDAMFLGPNKLVAVAWNKTLYGANRVGADKVNKNYEWMEFKSTTGDLAGAFGGVKKRMRLFTVRPKAAFTLSVAKDDKSDRYAIVTIPSKKSKDIVISQFGKDNMLVRENVLRADGDEKFNVRKYYPVGADIVDGKLYVLSLTYQSLLEVDLNNGKLLATYELPQIGDYNGIAHKDGFFYILSVKDGKDVVYKVTMPKAS